MEPQRRLSIEPLKQSIKLGLGAMALIVLVLINSNIHELVLCLMKNPIDKVVVAPPSLSPNCTSRSFRHGLAVDICQGEDTSMVAFYLKDTILRSYSDAEATRLVDWLRRCTGPDYRQACPLYPSSNPKCPSYSLLNSLDYICHLNDSSYLVINRFPFMKKESKDVIAFLLR